MSEEAYFVIALAAVAAASVSGVIGYLIETRRDRLMSEQYRDIQGAVVDLSSRVGRLEGMQEIAGTDPAEEESAE